MTTIKILVIEDNNNLREDLAEILTETGFEVMTAENGLIGLQLIGAFQPDLVISDLMMPELDGCGVARALRANPVTASIPLILMSAHTVLIGKLRVELEGPNEYLNKPFTFDELSEAIAHSLDHKSEVSHRVYAST